MIPIKRGKQISAMRQACGTANAILQELCRMIQPGITTGEIDLRAKQLFADAGVRSAFFRYHGFPGQICISVNEEVVHGIGGRRIIHPGDILKLDVGVIQNGWVGDTATTHPVGSVSTETWDLLNATEEALFIGISQARPGNRLGDLCSAIEQSVLARGYTVVREFVGHGVGRKLHEEPQIPNFGKKHTGPHFRPGMTLAIEPMVNFGRPEVKILADHWTVITADRQPSAHFEHTILVTEGEPEILTWRERATSTKPGSPAQAVLS
ncbi:MAG: type I methionyl aminopeptidase [Verrucomicrobiales bacterium]